MIRSQRTLHARVWPFLAPVIVAGLLWTLALRPPAGSTVAPRVPASRGESVR